MKRFFCLSLIKLVVILLFSSEVSAATVSIYDKYQCDTTWGNQSLYNGRIWRDLYVSVREDQFLFSDEFMSGNVTMNGQTFSNLKLRYDILNDEIIIITEKGLVLQLNKEMVDGFSIKNGSKIFNFRHLVSDSLNKIDGYFHVLYEGRSSLYAMYYKEISTRGPGKNYENFVQADRLFIVKDNIFHQIRSRSDFYKVLSDKKQAIKEYVRGKGLRINRKNPDSFVPGLQFYDSLR